MPVSVDHMAVQLCRLERHTISAAKVSAQAEDTIALMDMAHVLRIWVEMKSDVDDFLATISPYPAFKNPEYTGDLKRLLKGSKHFRLQTTGGARTAEGRIEGFMHFQEVLSDDDLKTVLKAGAPRARSTSLTFSQWLGSEILVFADPSASPSKLGISRQMLVKRVANFLGASHPMGSDTGVEQENLFDAPIRELQRMSLLGIPATYSLLLEMAQQIIGTLKPVIKT